MCRTYRFLIIIASLLLWGCNDDDLTSRVSLEEGEVPADAIRIDCFDGYISLTDTPEEVVGVEILSGEFLTTCGGDKVYFEQNDDDKTRIGQVRVIFKNGASKICTLAQPSASRADAAGNLRQFYRHYGIGYSYEAIYGNYCDLSDFRCQILNRAVVDSIKSQAAIDLLMITPLSTTRYFSSNYSSLVDYVESTYFRASGSGGILCLFSGDVQTDLNIFEEGTIDKHILTNEVQVEDAEYSLSYGDILDCLDRFPNLLTASFKAACNKITADDKSIDDFLHRYGTHVVVYSKLGASIRLNVQVETQKFSTTYSQSAISEAMIATMFQDHESDEMSKKAYEILEDCRCQISIIGGEPGIFDNLVGLNTFDNSSINGDQYAQWLNSVKFDDDDIANSTVSLIAMDVAPIWYFIPDATLAKRVEARVTGNTSLISDVLGNRNFVNTSFASAPTSVTCRIGTSKQTFSNPETVEVIASNRHVATICHELVPEISKSEKVYVAYPIYEGKVKLSEGLCVYNGGVYHVKWDIDHFSVTRDTDLSASGTLYMNCGSLSTEQMSNLEYEQSHLILGCERPGGIAVDGSLAGEMHAVHKYFGHFYLDTKTIFDNLPGWSYSTTTPAEVSYYGSTFDSNTYTNRMVRNDSYVYQLNLTEIGYE